MAGTSLLALLDDIITVLDDVAALSKVAAKKTAGVLGDDLALNAEQVSGVKAERELPVVWAVAKGSFLNKLILVPAALLISAFLPPLITILLVIGGLFLCFEGAEKIFEKLLHNPVHREQEKQELLAAAADPSADMLAIEQQKIKGAIKTDFILSAEIIVIVLGSVASAPFSTQVMVVSSLAIAITVGVYGLVAAIVKLDDLGLYLLRKSLTGNFNLLQRQLGRGLLIFAPFLMKLLAVVGTAAMFLVGGGILSHSLPSLSAIIAKVTEQSAAYIGSINVILPIAFDGLLGVFAGVLVLLPVHIFSRLKKQQLEKQ